MIVKQCSKCKERKSFSEFYKDKRRKDDLRSCCKKCYGDRTQKYYQANKDKYAEYLRKYRQTHRIEYLENARKYRKTIIGCLRKRFTQIKQRCGNPKNKSYENYGGREIKCLFKDVNEFIDYVVNELQINPYELHIDRIDNDGNYEKGNIRFVTQAENNKNNRRKTNDPIQQTTKETTQSPPCPGVRENFDVTNRAEAKGG